MVYFYAVLGMCMMAGIMAIFEMGLALASRSSVTRGSLFEQYPGQSDGSEVDDSAS